MKQGTKIITLDNGYHLWTNTQGEGRSEERRVGKECRL